MNGKQHFKGFYILTALIVILIVMFWNWKFAIPLPLMFWVIFPDLDLGIDIKIGKSESHVHRLLYTHSLIYPAIVTFTITMIVDEALIYYYDIYIDSFFIGLVLFKFLQYPLLIHLVLDLRVRSKKMKGTYCLLWFSGKRLNGKNSTRFLWINIIIGCLIYLV